MITLLTATSHPLLLAVPTVSELPWAPPLLQDNAFIVLLIITFAVVNLLACHPKGVLAHQIEWLGDTHNARTFEALTIVYPWLKPMLYAQFFLFSSLSLFCALDNAPAAHLKELPTPETLSLIIFCLCVPFCIYAFQFFSYNWFCFLFRTRFQQIIMNRTYLASNLLLSPLTMVVFIGTMSGTFSRETTLILLAVLFILSQILFIFNGIKIFLTGFGSFLIIIAYLCTLEIAPLWVFWIRITT